MGPNQRIRLDLAYHGAVFCGWQIQPQNNTVQGELEKALHKLYGCSIGVQGAGRTDAGVHALQQVAHLDLPWGLSRGPDPSQLKRALNAITCDGLVVNELELSDDRFHARFSPHRKTYAYHLYFGDRAHPMLEDRSHLVHGQQHNWDDAQLFWAKVKGHHDFGSYCSSSNDTGTTERSIVNTSLESLSPRHRVLRIQGKGFLQHMVRILAGTVLGIAQGKVKLTDAMTALKCGPGHRDKLGLTLPAKGLWLESTEYLEREDWQKT